MGREGVVGKPLPPGLSEPRKGLFWVAMPTFEPGENDRVAYRALYQQIGADRQRFLDADAVVSTCAATMAAAPGGAATSPPRCGAKTA